MSAELIATSATSSQQAVIKRDAHLVQPVQDQVAEEVPIAMVYNGISYAVMLATPQDFEDFAIGFSLAEGIIHGLDEVYGIEVVRHDNGIEVHIDLATERFHRLKERRRNLAGKTGCGLCGAESLDQAMRLPAQLTPQPVTSVLPPVASAAIDAAHHRIRELQPLQLLTGATHACAWVAPDGSICLVREDVGRHNALDKLIGARLRQHIQTPGFVLTTSRASYEMVQKVAAAGAAMLVAVSAPTGLAIRIAQQCGMTLIGFARNQQFVIYSGAERVQHKE